VVEENVPPLYRILGIPSDYGTEGAEIGFLRTLIQAHAGKVKSGNITIEGRKLLLAIYNDLNEIEHLLKE